LRALLSLTAQSLDDNARKEHYQEYSNKLSLGLVVKRILKVSRQLAKLEMKFYGVFFIHNIGLQQQRACICTFYSAMM
jgi:hypothetical protein